MIGKLLETMSANYRDKKLTYISYSTQLKPLDTDLEYEYYMTSGSNVFTSMETLDTPENNGIIRIGRELLSYKYPETVSGVKRLYVIERGYNNTPIEKHNIGDFIYEYDTLIVKEYDSLNTRDISVGEQGIVLNQSKEAPAEIKGVDVILQDIRLTMINIGNDILNQQDTLDDITNTDVLSSFYLQGFVNHPLGITNVEITSIQVSPTNPNKLQVVANIETQYQTYSNVEFFIATGRRTI